MTVPKEPLWYAVHTHPREEFKAFSHLRRQNYQAYLPRYVKTIRHARKSDRVIRPFFPRYLFVRLNLAINGWRAIRSTMGVNDIVCFGEQPAPLPAGVIDALQTQEIEGFIELGNKSAIKPGDNVVVLEGPFAQQIGRCISVSDNERVAILLDLLGRKVRVLINTEMVAAA
jgi:transcriptional antiterminator RfaH